jgi:hypothetical protein
VAVLAAFQVITILGWASYEERMRATAPTFRIPLRPTDPVEILRWRGLAAHPLDAEIDPGAADAVLTAEAVAGFVGDKRAYFGEALVGFCPRGEIERVCALAHLGAPAQGSPARHWARAFVRVQDRRVEGEPARRIVRVDLGVDRLFSPMSLPGTGKEPGWELEVSDRPGQSLLPVRLWLRGRPLDLG